MLFWIWEDARIELIEFSHEISNYLKASSNSFFPVQNASFLNSTLNSFQGVLKVSSRGSTRLNPCRGRWVDGKGQSVTDKPKAPAHSACVCLSPGWGDRALPGEALETNTATPIWDPQTIMFQEWHPVPNTHLMCTAPNYSKHREVLLTCPHSGSDCVGTSLDFAGYELCDSGQVFSVPQFPYLQIGW